MNGGVKERRRQEITGVRFKARKEGRKELKKDGKKARIKERKDK